MKDINKIRTRATKVRKILRSLYPEVKPQLHFRSPFELLLATILSSQCTDKQVNRVTPKLFHRLKSPQDFTRASLEEIETRPGNLHGAQAEVSRLSPRPSLPSSGQDSFPSINSPFSLF